MRKILCIVLSAFFCINCFSQENVLTSPKKLVSEDKIPDLLQGIWQGSDRLILFGDEKNNFNAVLRTFYQWYDDRAAEPSEYKQIKKRDRNDATSNEAEQIEIKYLTIVENASKTAGVYELEVKYPREKYFTYIPVAVINGQLYLNFLIKDRALKSDDFTSTENESDYSVVNTAQKNYQDGKIILSGFYRDASSALGVTISKPTYKKELLSYFIDGSSIYRIRYWKSGMEYSYEQATFYDGDNEYSVDKFLRVGGILYQCTTGRSKRIRNIEKTNLFANDFTADIDGIIIAFGKPYLVCVPGTGKWDELIKIVEENNKRRHPPAKPLFPIPEIKFHWKDIEDIELYNPRTWNRRNLDLHH